MDEILASILRAEIIIADLTGENPNVFHELGLAHAVKAGVILITQSLEDIPFDLQGIRCFKYENTIAGARTLAQVLEKTIRPMRAAPTAHSVDIQQMQDLLQKGFNAWFGMGDIVLEWNEYLAIVRDIDELAVDDEHASFLAAAAAYFGRHMARMVARVRENRSAIRALATYIAQTPMQRPAWRASAMLERCEVGAVREEIAAVLARLRGFGVGEGYF